MPNIPDVEAGYSLFSMQKSSVCCIGWSRVWTGRKSSGLRGAVQIGFLHRGVLAKTLLSQRRLIVRLALTLCGEGHPVPATGLCRKECAISAT
jgi:hypothetical protein